MNEPKSTPINFLPFLTDRYRKKCNAARMLVKNEKHNSTVTSAECGMKPTILKKINTF